jgi:tetratricopeptide (TPR) repeat protein
LKNATGNIRWEIIGAENVPAEAERLHQSGRMAGSRGEHGKALADFEEAARLAPQWPYPKYDAAFTYLLMGDSAKAEEFYVATAKLAPRGFFTALTAVDALRREREGEYPRGMYLAYVMLEWESDPNKKLKTLREMVKRVPSFAPAWKDLAGLLEDDQSTLEAIEKGLAAHPDAETKGILLMNRAALWHRQGKRDEAIRSLGELILAPESSLGSVELAKVTLAHFTR